MRDKYRNIFFPNGDIKVFIDMFCGACSISLWIAENYPDCRIILNDANKELIELYRVFKEEYETFEKAYQVNVDKFLTLDSYEERKEFYYSLRTKYCHHWQKYSAHENAADLFFMMRVNFNGMWKAYNICNNRYSTPPGTLTQKEKFFDIKEVRKFRDFLNKCEIVSGDFGNLSQYAGDNAYFYADPPYRDSVVDYQCGFSENDQIRLAEFLKDMSQKGCWIAESNKEIGDNFWENNFGPEYKKHYVTAKYTAGRGTSLIDAEEVLVTNF